MKKIKLLLPSENDTLALGMKLAASLQQGVVIFLYGQLGAGKTTLVRGILRGFGYTGKVKSPTYTIVEPYEESGSHIYHFDLYRLNHPDELLQIGIADYFSETSVCLIEWPEKGFPLLPAPDMACYIEADGEGRQVLLESKTDRGDRILAYF